MQTKVIVMMNWTEVLTSKERGLYIERLYRPLSKPAARQEREKKVYITLARDAVRNMEDLSEMHDGLVLEPKELREKILEDLRRYLESRHAGE